VLKLEQRMGEQVEPCGVEATVREVQMPDHVHRLRLQAREKQVPWKALLAPLKLSQFLVNGLQARVRLGNTLLSLPPHLGGHSEVLGGEGWRGTRHLAPGRG